MIFFAERKEKRKDRYLKKARKLMDKGDYRLAWAVLNGDEKTNMNSVYRLEEVCELRGVCRDQLYVLPQTAEIPVEPTADGGVFPEDSGLKNRPEGLRPYDERLFVLAARDYVADPMESLCWLRQASDRGVAAASYNVGMMYARGVGVKKHLPEALRWFEIAVTQGDPDAAQQIIQVRQETEHRPPVQVKPQIPQPLSIDSLLDALGRAEQGDPEGAVQAALLYKAGIDGTVKIGRALKWLERAVTLGSGEAAAKLGHIYMYGEGVPVDPERGLQWMTRAIEMGDTGAMLFVGTEKINGELIRSDVPGGVEWIRKAAQAGNPEAMLTMAEIYRKGIGVDPDEAEAQRWEAGQVGD